MRPATRYALWTTGAALAAACAYFLWLLVVYVTLPTEVPDDFEVEYSAGPCHVDWGPVHYVTIRRAAGAGGDPAFEAVRWTLTYVRGSAAAPPVKAVTGKSAVPPEKALELYREICWQRFFGMRERYYDPRIIDGGGATLTVTAGGRKKTVHVSNTRVRAFDRIAAAIARLL